MKKYKYQYIYEQDIMKEKYQVDGYVLLPLFTDFNFNEIKNNSISSHILIDPFITFYYDNINEISEICYKIFEKNLLLKDSIFYLTSIDEKHTMLKNIEKLIIYTYYKISNSNTKLIIPLSSYNNIVNDFFVFNNFLESLSFSELSFIFISNDRHLISIFDKNIENNDIYWVEGEFDKFTYNIFMPDKEYKVAGNWMNIFKILEYKNDNHYGIIDKDGFLTNNKKYLTFGDNLFFSKYSECENLWLSEEILNIFQKNNKSFSKNDFLKDVIELAKKDQKSTIQRFINRQVKLKSLGYPYNNDDIVKKVVKIYSESINSNNYNSILSYYDNKSIFNLLLKRISCKNIKTFYELISKLKKDIRALKINPII